MTHPGRGRIELQSTPDGPRAAERGPAPDAEYWDRLWGSTALEGVEAAAAAGHLPRHLRVTFARRVAPPARVLEAGCGPAHFTIALHARGYDAVGLDWGAATLARVGQRHPALDLRQGDVRASPFDDASFDALYSPGVCEHLEAGPEPVLADAFRVLRPGGLAFVSTPHLNRLRRWRWRHGRAGADGPFHQHYFAAATLARVLERLGFEVVATRPYGTWATLVEEWPALGRLPVGRAAGILDLPVLARALGSTCLWVARKPDQDHSSA